MQLRGTRFQPTTDPPRLTVKKTAAYVLLIFLGLGLLRLFDLNYYPFPLRAPAHSRPFGSLLGRRRKIVL